MTRIVRPAPRLHVGAFVRVENEYVGDYFGVVVASTHREATVRVDQHEGQVQADLTITAETSRVRHAPRASWPAI